MRSRTASCGTSIAASSISSSCADASVYHPSLYPPAATEHANLLQRHQSGAHQFIELREEGVDSFLGIDDLHDRRRIARYLDIEFAIESTAGAKAQRPMQD